MKPPTVSFQLLLRVLMPWPIQPIARSLLFPLLFLILALAHPDPAAATVTVTDNGNGTVTLANSLISVIVSKTNGTVSSVISSAHPGVNLVASGGIGLELTHIGAGPETSASNDYWTDITAGGTEAYSVVENSGTMVDVQIRNPTACPDLVTYPNGLWDWSLHHVLLDNDSGFYTYHVWRHTASQPESYASGVRLVSARRR